MFNRKNNDLISHLKSWMGTWSLKDKIVVTCLDYREYRGTCTDIHKTGSHIFLRIYDAHQVWLVNVNTIISITNE